MNSKHTIFHRRYAVVLGEHLVSRDGAGLREAVRYGKKAMGLGLVILDLAKIHESALLTAIPGNLSNKAREAMVSRGQEFFIEAITPIEETHLAAVQARKQRQVLSGTLHNRTDELARSKKNLEKGRADQKEAEVALKLYSEERAKSLGESRSRLEVLRRQAHEIISKQEAERGKGSRELNNQISQGLLGINLRLLDLQRKGTREARLLLREIASTRAMVRKSIGEMRSFARRFEGSHGK